MRPVMDNAPTVAAVRGVKRQIKTNTPDSAIWSHSRQALCTMKGEQHAKAYLAPLQAQHHEIDDLATPIAILLDAMPLASSCRAVVKALGVRHG